MHGHVDRPALTNPAEGLDHGAGVREVDLVPLDLGVTGLFGMRARPAVDGDHVVPPAQQSNQMAAEKARGTRDQDPARVVHAPCYPEPKPAVAEIKDHVAFWHGVSVVR